MLRKSAIEEVLKLLKSEYSETTTALNFSTPFQLLVSTMLAAQSTDKQVNIVTKNLFEQYPDARSLLTLSFQIWKTILKQ
jgi:endonuclease-3